MRIAAAHLRLGDRVVIEDRMVFVTSRVRYTDDAQALRLADPGGAYLQQYPTIPWEALPAHREPGLTVDGYRRFANEELIDVIDRMEEAPW